jgi:hypothetical protein
MSAYRVILDVTNPALLVTQLLLTERNGDPSDAPSIAEQERAWS